MTAWAQSLIRISNYEVETLQKRLAEIAERRGGAEMKLAVLDAEAEGERNRARMDAEAGMMLGAYLNGWKSRKAAALIPSPLGTALITVLPEELQSPLLTAEWEQRLKEIERREREPEVFMEGIAAMLRELIRTCKPVPGAEVLFPDKREVVGKCPRCGKNVAAEDGRGYFCVDRSCGFALWEDNRFFAAKRIPFTKTMAKALLRDGRVHLKGCWSEKTGKTYDAVAIMTDDGKKIGFHLEFEENIRC